MNQRKHKYTRRELIEELLKMDSQIIHGTDIFKQVADALGNGEPFHPDEESDLLEQTPEELVNYSVDDRRSRADYVRQRLLHAVLLAYLKHQKMNDVIGWEALGSILHNAMCEAIGDEEFCKWNDFTTNA